MLVRTTRLCRLSIPIHKNQKRKGNLSEVIMPLPYAIACKVTGIQNVQDALISILFKHFEFIDFFIAYE